MHKRPTHLHTALAAAALVLLASGAITTSAFADCALDGSNLLQSSNCGFGSNTAGWDAVGNTIVHNADGDPTSGSGETSCASCGSAGGQSPCVQILSSTTYGFGIRTNDVGGTSDTGCGLAPAQYATTDCTGPTVGSAPGAGGIPVAGWNSWNGSFTSDAAAQSAVLQAGCNRSVPGPMQVRIDNAYLGVGITMPVDLERFTVE